LNFNTTTTTATAQPFNTGLKLGTTNATTTLGGGGIFSKPAGQAAAPAASTFVGLGGIDVTATQPKLGDNKQDGIKVLTMSLSQRNKIIILFSTTPD